MRDRGREGGREREKERGRERERVREREKERERKREREGGWSRILPVVLTSTKSVTVNLFRVLLYVFIRERYFFIIFC